MNRIPFPFVVLLVALVLPSVGLAKGASQATIVGPGLDEPIVLGSDDLASAETLGGIAMQAGFYAAVFGQSPDPMLEKPPAGKLGPSYTVTYTMPGPNSAESELVQEIYPYAKPDAVTYVEPGQRFWGTQWTPGGWYVTSSSTVKEQLVAVGLPSTAPVIGGGDGSRWLPATLASVTVIAGLGSLGLILGRRRPRPVAA